MERTAGVSGEGFGDRVHGGADLLGAVGYGDSDGRDEVEGSVLAAQKGKAPS
jgi:hypothetical protein